MSDYVHRLRRLPRLGSRPEPPPQDTGDYTIPEPLDARMINGDEAFMSTDFDDGESPTITRHR